MSDSPTTSAVTHTARTGPGGTLEALAAFEEHLAATHVRCRVSRTRPALEPFDSRFTRVGASDLAIVDSAVSPCAVHRGRTDQALQDGGVVGIQMLLSGRERFGSGPEAEILEPGQMLIWDGARPIDAEVLEPIVKRTLLIDRERAWAVSPQLQRVVGRPLSARTASIRLFTDYVGSLVHELPHLDETGREAAARASLELFRATLVHGPADHHRALRADVERYIESHLGEPDLSPRTIADAHAVSLRTLYTLWDGDTDTIASYIRRRRLERCHQDLRASRDALVTDISYRWGFRDTAHFSRIFKREYGITPSEARSAGAGPAAA